MVRVLFVAHQPSRHLLQLQKHLAFNGIQAQIAVDPSEVCRESADIVHLFTLSDREIWEPFVQRSREQGLLLVMTPNYWSPHEFLFEKFASRLSWIVPRSVAMDFYERFMRTIKHRFFNKQQEILQECRIILPNSEAEKAQLMDEYAMKDAKRFSVGVNPVSAVEIDASNPDEFVQAFGLKDFVLCVGRFGEKQNQLGLIQALRRTDIPIVFMGEMVYSRPRYLQECRQAAKKCNGEVLFITEPQSPSLIYSAMKNARVLVSPGWWDQTCSNGLAAALCGCNVVMTNRSPWREYFGDAAIVCDPASHESMRQTVLQAYAAEKNKTLAADVRDRFAWEQAAAGLAKKYIKLSSQIGVIVCDL